MGTLGGQTVRHRHDVGAHAHADGRAPARAGHPRRGRARGDERRAAPHLRRRGARDPRLRGHAAADRPRPDDLAALGRRADDRARAQRPRRSTACSRSAPAAATRRRCWRSSPTRSTRSSASARWSHKARRNLQSLKLKNVRLKHGDGSADLGEDLAVDAIVVTAGATHVPTRAAASYLKPGGRMVLPLAQRGDGERRRAAAHGDRGDARRASGSRRSMR